MRPARAFFVLVLAACGGKLVPDSDAGPYTTVGCPSDKVAGLECWGRIRCDRVLYYEDCKGSRLEVYSDCRCVDDRWRCEDRTAPPICSDAGRD